MADNQHHVPEDLLDRATQALRDMSVSDGPSEALIEATLARLVTPDVHPGLHVHPGLSLRAWHAASIKTLSRLAAAAVFILGACGMIYWLVRPSPSFGQVVQRLRQAQVVSFKATATIKDIDGREQEIISDVVIAEPSRMRQTMRGATLVLDFNASQAMMLYPQSRLALVGKLDSIPAGQRMPNILATLKEVGPADGAAIGEKQIGGRRARGFVVAQRATPLTIWVDVQTRLPVEIEMSMQVGASPRMRLAMTDFRWDAQAGQPDLDLTVPVGYEIRQMRLQMGPLTEHDIVGALNALGAINTSQFPPGVGMTPSLAQIIAGIGTRVFKDSDAPQWKQVQSSLLEFMTVMGRGVAFGQVVDRVREARSVSLKAQTTIRMPDGKQQEVQADVLIADPGRMRQSIDGGPITILDLQARRMLVLDPRQKQATVAQLTDIPQEQVAPNILDDIRNLDPAKGEPVGVKEVAGRKLQGFKATRSNGQIVLWVDMASRLPVEADIEMLPGMRVTMTDFRWDPPVDERLLSLTPPAGYEIHNVQWNMGPLSERDVVAALKALGEMNGQRLPAGFDMASLGQVLVGMEKRALADGNAAQWQKMQGRVMEQAMIIGRGLAFVVDPQNGADWHYAGADVQLGKAGTPVMWYRPAGSAMYRVIGADMSVREVKAEELANVPSVRMGNPLLPFAPTTRDSGR
jgi:hypothetical protein